MIPNEFVANPISINKYIIFKNNNNFYEGRVVDILIEDNKTLYNVISFNTFEYFQITENDLITHSSLESKKKYNLNTIYENSGEIKMPGILKNRLKADKDYYMINSSPINFQPLPVKMSIKKILQDFMVFFQQNSLLFEQTEASEVIKGFTDLFNTFLSTNLLYESEKKFYMETLNFNEKIDFTNNFGSIHLLRLLYLIQKINIQYNDQQSIQLIVIDFTIYLIDFLNFKYKDYFL